MKNIKMFVMDVDGTLTDGRIIIGSDGTEYKCFNVKDGLGIKKLIGHEIVPVIITGRKSTIVELRCKELGITEVHQQIDNKLSQLKLLMQKYNVTFREIAFIGDDVNDVEAMKQCHVRFAVADAVQEVKSIATHLTSRNGGQGAVREAIDLLLSVDKNNYQCKSSSSGNE